MIDTDDETISAVDANGYGPCSGGLIWVNAV
jgi:hypothetical protein